MTRTFGQFGLTITAIASLCAAGCDGGVTQGQQPPTQGPSDNPDDTLVLPTVDKVDILLAIDNSRSMADKQAILSQTVPELLTSLTENNPGISIHIGMVTSSLGGYGGDICESNLEPANNDRGHLVYRSQGGSVQTYQDIGFLAWDPAQNLVPPGEDDAQVLSDAFAAMVVGAGQTGCGFEASLESWYRFLIQPDPYESAEAAQNYEQVLTGTDDTILSQRAAFLRPDSMVVVLQLTDENDCSFSVEGSTITPFATSTTNGGTPHTMPRPRSICASDPNDACCLPCGSPFADACAPDPTCQAEGDFLTQSEDPINLRCFDQKRRFGIDLLYPVERYVAGLSEEMVADRNGQLQPNPLYADGLRDPGLVVFATVTGVPWQDVARQNASGQPDLINGVAIDGEPFGGFMSGPELAQTGTWDLIVGDPSAGVAPTDPLMIESTEPRTGTHPITGEALSIQPGSSSINGNERTVETQGDLQYACIMPIAAPVDCSDQSVGACDCRDFGTPTDNPLCASNPADGGKPTLQIAAKAYPGTRQLLVAKGIGDQALVGSICAAQIEDTAPLDYAYRPVIRSMVERMLPRLEAK